MKEIALKKMLEELKDNKNPAIDSIHNFLCDQEDANLFEMISLKNKTLQGAYKYCVDKAKKSKYRDGQSAMVPDKVVFGWIVEYYKNTKNEKPKTSKKESPKKETPKSKTKPKSEETQLSLF